MANVHQSFWQWITIKIINDVCLCLKLSTVRAYNKYNTNPFFPMSSILSFSRTIMYYSYIYDQSFDSSKNKTFRVFIVQNEITYRRFLEEKIGFLPWKNHRRLGSRDCCVKPFFENGIEYGINFGHSAGSWSCHRKKNLFKKVGRYLPTYASSKWYIFLKTEWVFSSDLLFDEFIINNM